MASLLRHARRRAAIGVALTLGLVLLGPPAGAAECTAPAFVRSQKAHAQGAEPATRIVSADFDRDGYVDLAFALWPPTVGTNVGDIMIRRGLPNGEFGPESLPYPVGGFPQDLAVGDFNRDGLPDLAIATGLDPFGGGVSILLASGTGGFGSLESYETSELMTGVAVADFDHDGWLDIAIVGITIPGGEPVARVFFGNGDGTFTSSPAVEVGGPADRVYAGDVKRDGHPDLVAIDTTNGLVRVTPGNGDRTFDAPLTPVAVPVQPEGAVLADWNRDGFLDAAVGGSGDPFGVTVLFGDGSGVLGSGVDYPQPPAPALPHSVRDVAAADVDGDGDIDLAASSGTGPEMWVLLNDGAGSFGPFVPYDTLAPGSYALTVADFNRDGRADVLTSNPNSDFFTLFTNDFGLPCDRPSFGPAPRVIAGGPARSLATSDWDGDGLEDMLAVDSWGNVRLLRRDEGTFVDDPALRTGLGEPVQILAGPFIGPFGVDLLIVDEAANEVRVLRGDGAGHLTNDYGIQVPTSPVAAVLGDFDPDGVLDVAVASYGSASVSVFPVDQTPGPTPSPVSIPGSKPRGLAAGDFQENGIDDLLVADENGPVWLVPRWPGGWDVPSEVANVGAGARGIVAGQFTADSHLDAAVTNSLADEVVILVGDGAGGFSSAGSYSVPDGPRDVKAADLDLDGVLDLVVVSFQSSQTWLLRGLAGGGFAAPVAYFSGDLGESALVEDLTGDGLPDVAVAGWSGVRLLPGSPTGDGSLVQPPRVTFPETPTGVALHDVNFDGALDLVALAREADQAMVALGAGDGTFGAPTAFPAGDGPEDLTIGDFDGDGAPDLAVSNALSDDVSILINDRTGGFTQPSLPFAANDLPGPLVTADLDRDGALDLVVLNVQGSSQPGVTLLLGAGDGTFGSPSQIDTTSDPTALAVADFNRDGDPDLLVSYVIPGLADDYFRPWLGGAGASFAPGTAVVPFAGSLGSSAVVAADFDRDGETDVALDGSSILVYLGDGGGGFASTSGFSHGGVVSDLAVGDWDGDGHLQLAFDEGASSSVAFTPWVGSGATVKHRYGTSALIPQDRIAAGDVNGDGRTDVVATEQGAGSTNTVAVLLNTNCLARRLAVVQQAPSCTVPSTAFDPQPTVLITDDAASTLLCANTAADEVTASLLPNAYGGALTGDSTETPTAGVVDFVDLGVSAPGRSYRLGFSHPTAGVARSDTFSQGLGALPFGISGPSEICHFQAPVYYSTLEGFDTYSWTLDAAPPLPSNASTAFLSYVLGGPHTLNVDVTQDGCPGSANPFALTSYEDLLNVTATLQGSSYVPPGGTSGWILGNTYGGGASTLQWGYRTSSGSGPLTPIPGATSGTYTITGDDFLSGTPGTYYVAVTATPQCGAPMESNEVEVTVYSTTTEESARVQSLAATAWADHITLQWVNPAIPFVAIHVNYITSPACTAPTTLSGWPITTGGAPGAQGSVSDTVYNPGWTRCYSVFVEYPGAVLSEPASIKVTAVDPAEDAAWAYYTGAAAMTQPGLGDGVIYAVSNDGLLHSVTGGAGGGLWPASWMPRALNGVSEVRPTALPVPVGGVSTSTIFLTSDGGTLYAIDADTGAELWTEPAGSTFTSAPAGMYTAFGGGHDQIHVGADYIFGLNGLYTWDLTGTLGPVWYIGEPPGNLVGTIYAKPSVDYTGNRVYFGSAEYSAAGHDTVWCADIATLATCSGWNPTPFGNAFPDNDVTTSPIPRGTTLLVAPVDGTVRGLDLDTGSVKWSFATGDGVVKGFVFPDHASDDVFFSTNTRVWRRTEVAGALNPIWSVGTVPNPSTPVYVASRNEVWVGGGDGKLYRLDASDGSVLDEFVLADTSTQIGAPALHPADGFAYVGAEDGRVFAVALPVIP